MSVEAAATPSRRALGPGGWRLAVIYVVAASAILAGLAALLLWSEERMRTRLVGYIVPDEFTGVADLLVEYVLRSQTRQILANALVAGSLLVVSLLLFRIKERFSAGIEAHHGLDGGRAYVEHPLWFQAFEEVKLLALYGAGFVFIFWLGHDSATWRRVGGTVLSYGFLFFTWAVDFGAPTPQRHRFRYGQILKAILKRPLRSLLFGAAFSLPVVGTAHLVGVLNLGSVAQVAIIFGVNVLAFVGAAAAGTRFGASLLPVLDHTPPPGIPARVAGWVVVLGLLGAGTFVGGNVAAAIHGKSQILKCRYDIDWSSVSVGTPKLGALLAGSIESDLSVDMTITNPNAVDVSVEDSRLVVASEGQEIASGSVSALSVPAGQTVSARVRLGAKADPAAFLRGAALNPMAWEVTLYVRVAEGIDFPIFIRRAK